MGPLPVELYQFTVRLENSKAVRLDFATASERDNAFFAIERSADGRVFEEIGIVAGAGHSNSLKAYDYTDLRPLSGKSYYRLRQVDNNGQSAYSQMLSIVNGRTGTVKISPQPALDRLNIQLDEQEEGERSWQILDKTGRTILSGIWPDGQQQEGIDVNTLEAGHYFLRINGGKTTESKSFVKQ